MRSAPEYEFRTTIVRGSHTEGDIHDIGARVRGAKHFTLQNYRGAVTLDPDFHGTSFSLEEMQRFRDILLHSVDACRIQE